MMRNDTENPTYCLYCNEKQLLIISKCLEAWSRRYAGQLNLLHDTALHERLEVRSQGDIQTYCRLRDEIEKHLKVIYFLLFPELYPNGSYGYNADNAIGNTYQIYRTILHKMAIEHHWNNVYSIPPLPSGNLGGVLVERLCI